MQPEALTIATRPRTAWQAADLGVHLTRTWARWLWPPFALAVAVTLAAGSLFLAPSGLAALWLVVVVWWAKPLYDRVLLTVAAHAVFGQRLGVRSTWQQRGSWARELVWQLTLARPQVHRAFYLPILQLEGLRHEQAAWRRRQLRHKGYASMLLAMGLVAEFIVVGSLVNLITLATQMPELHPGTNDTAVWETSYVSSTAILVTAYVAAVLLVEPFYLLACFALYLNSRITQEGWDMELAFRGLTRRIQKAGAGISTASSGIAALVVGLILGAAPAPAPAAKAPPPSAAQPKQVMADVLAEEAFDTTRTEQRLRYKGGPTPGQQGDEGSATPDTDASPTDIEASSSTESPNSPSGAPPTNSPTALLAVGSSVRLLLIAALLAATGVLAYVVFRQRPAGEYKIRGSARKRGRNSGYRVQDHKGQSLAQKLEAAQQYAQQQRPREALAALYQAAHLVVAGDADHAPSSTWTETQLLEAAAKTNHNPSRRLIPRIVHMWQLAAYAHRPPDAEQLLGLVEQCQTHFVRRSV